MLKGVDVSNWQAGIAPSQLGVDFCICKATEGDYFVDGYCDGFVQDCKANGVLWGFYHFASGKDPIVEAEYFYNNCKGYFGEGIPVLDFEIDTDANVTWCEMFLNRLHELTGVWAMLYISASRCSQYANSWIPQNCGLWVAGYPQNYTDWTDDEMPYDISPWEFAAIWQFTSSLRLGYEEIDGDYAYMDASAWAKYAGSTGQQEKPSKTIDQLAVETLQGIYGNNETRKKALGALYDQVQQRVNEYYYIADAVIRGNWGDGWNRRSSLEGAGYNYNMVQRIVNQKLEG